jgi:EpsI family protein
MGQISTLKILILVGMFALTAYGLSLAKTAEPQPKLQSLGQTFTSFAGWQTVSDQQMEQQVVEALKLDDYLFRSFNKDGETLTLYIGYYLSAKKVGAAHDPMVCFPGQGWCLTKQDRPARTETKTGLPVTYSVMIAEREGRKELVAYWFQANEKPLPDTLGQKLSLLQQRVQGKKEDNAFVRITMSLDKRSKDDALRVIDDFIRGFYPGFIDFVVGKRSACANGISSLCS